MLSLIIFNKANDTRDIRIDSSLYFPNTVWLIPGPQNKGIEEDKENKLFKNYSLCFQWVINNSIPVSIHLKLYYSFDCQQGFFYLPLSVVSWKHT